MTSADAAFIKTKLESLGHYDCEWLEGYMRFIVETIAPWGYCEEHHILPKGVPEFESFASFDQYPWNCKCLSLRDHLIAHYLLLRALRNDWHIWRAFVTMIERVEASRSRLDRELAEKIKTRATESGVLDYWEKRQERKEKDMELMKGFL